MHFSYVILADAATSADGKLYIHGGGIGRINPQTLPWTHPQLAVAACLMLTPEEAASRQTHQLIIRHLDPLGVPLGDPARLHFDFILPPEANEDEPPFVLFTITFNNMLIHNPGHYKIEFSIDDEVIHTERYIVTEPALLPPLS